jgi:hypothetical protein
MHLERMRHSPDQFENYLKDQGLSRESFIDEIAYRQEITRLMMQLYGWREMVSDTEVAQFKKKMLQDTGNSQHTYSYEVMHVQDKKKLPSTVDAVFWKAHSKDTTSFKDKTLAQVPDSYEAFLKNAHAGDYSPPIEAFGQWHIVRVVAKNTMQLPDDEVVRNYLFEQKCLAHLSEWVDNQLLWVYKS